MANSTKFWYWLPCILFTACAGGLAWAIRGQYGHETGAMMAGLLVSATLVFLLCPELPLGVAGRAVAFCTVAMGFGGSMTYGVTLGLSHNPEMIGNYATLSWSLLGCAIKGGVWIGFAAVFLGMGLGAKRYCAPEILFVMLAMIGAYFIGVRVFNYPFSPDTGELPLISFSDFNRWLDNTEIRPRREQWGGLWCALIALFCYVRLHRRDRLAGRMAIWGVVGGALGFSIGQSIQAYHAWNVEWFREHWPNLDPNMNWWNVMETTFGFIMGGFMGFGLWWNRRLIGVPEAAPTTGMERTLPYWLEGALLLIHLPMLIAVEFASIRNVDALYDLGLILGLIPMVAVAGGRIWPYLVIFPVILTPIAGKTLRELAYNNDVIGVPWGSILYIVLPMILSLATLVWFVRRNSGEPIGRRAAAVILMVPAATFFYLNYAFFRFPFPWREWTGRTPSGIWYTVMIAALALMVVVGILAEKRPKPAEPIPAEPKPAEPKPVEPTPAENNAA